MEHEGNREKVITSSKHKQPKTFHRFLLSLPEAMPYPPRKKQEEASTSSWNESIFVVVVVVSFFLYVWFFSGIDYFI